MKPADTTRPVGSDGGLSRRELEREQGEALPDREGTLDRLSDRATAEQASRAGDKDNE